MFIVSLLLWGCSGEIGGLFSEDTTYLTPIPEATLAAHRVEMPITNKLEAVIAAQVFLRTTRLDYQELPKVCSVEKLRLAEAYQAVNRTDIYDDRPDDTRVWLVILEGEWTIIPPDPGHDFTPAPPARGCAYVILDQNNERN